MFVFNLETYNDQEFAKSYAAGLYDVNWLRDRWDRDLSPDETVTEKDNVIVFDGSNGNPVMNMLQHISEDSQGDEGTNIDEDGDEIVSSYGLLLLANNSSGFDSWVLLNSSVKELKYQKNFKTARGKISLPFRSGVKIVNTCEVPQHNKFIYTKSHIKVSLEKICTVENTVFNLNFLMGKLTTRLIIEEALLIQDIFGSHILD